MAAPKGNDNAKKHGGEGLKKRVETDLTTKSDYSRFLGKLADWGLSPDDTKQMGMLGDKIEIQAWQRLISQDAVGAYLWAKENLDDVNEIMRLGNKAQYHLSKAGKDLLTLYEILRGDNTLDYETILQGEKSQ